MPDETPHEAMYPVVFTPKLNAALAKAQGMLAGASKDSKNPAFKRPDGSASTYASLASVIDAIREAFAACELAYPQTTVCDNDSVTVITHLRHSSGEFMTSPFRVPVVQKTPQGFGSASTYARRFGLMAIAGIAAEDDDGQAHTEESKKPRKEAKPSAPTPPPKQNSPTADQLAKLIAAFDGLGVSVKALEDKVGYSIAALDMRDFEGLRKYFAEKKAAGNADPDEAARELVKRQAEKSLAEASEKPRFAVFDLFVNRIKAATSPQAVALLLAETATEKLLQDGDKKALQRSAADRTLILQDKANEAKKGPRIEIKDDF